ncbi:MAG: putative manganese-dependent inorganic diphosphatase [Eubacteriales bacterium]|nr:putative manganese-dependent inorganic diphosphatase [Eubacteriales bacterium]MDD3074731.1 putative manganese-dependent inorganic diphosphatase [Eubacteriales bacterium]
MEREIVVLGHRNPDTDSICSAIAYAALKKELGENTTPGCLGAPNRETAYVLNHFGVDIPHLVVDVYPQVSDMMRREIYNCSPKTTLQEAGRLMQDKGVNTFSVVDEDKRLKGLLTTGDLAHYLLMELGLEMVTGGSRTQEILNTPISALMKTEGIVSFQDDDLVEQVKKVMLETRYRNYPVVDEHNHLLGMVARYDLLALKRKQVILVDHNERSQSVPGIEDAEILEIIDHHRLGDVQTGEPLFFRCEPVGSTCTIIGFIYQQHNVEPSPQVAGLLCAGILSDTVLFKSPTCTTRDRQMAGMLRKRAAIELDTFGRAMFHAGSALAERPAREIFQEDFKEFQLGDLKIGVGQVEALGIDGFAEVKRSLLCEMNNLIQQQGYDLVLMMLTDIIQEGTGILVAGEDRFVSEAFGKKVEDGYLFLPGVLSRKKQIIPQLARLAALK